MESKRVIINDYGEEDVKEESERSNRFKQDDKEIKQDTHLEKAFARLSFQDTQTNIRTQDQLEAAFGHCSKKYKNGGANFNWLDG